MTQREVALEGGAPWGFRMHGGVDLKTPLKVSRVNPGSKAAQRGIREGDLVTSINHESTKALTNNEAHNLLKSSGSTLQLGLNETNEGSPKRRQYHTIHQETHQETIKRSSVTYTLKETLERSSSRKPKFNEFEAYERRQFINGQDTKLNGSDVTVVTNIPVSQKSTPSSSATSTPSTLVPDGKNISSDHAIASRQSSYSNCSSIPDEGPQHAQDYQDSRKREMNDGQERVSKSKRRRQRKKNLLNRTLSHESQSQSEAETDDVDETNVTESEKNGCDLTLEPTADKIDVLRLKRIEHKYKVESPKELKLRHVKLKAKSKSLDDDDFLRIQELSEASESEDTSKYQSNVVISEASSEENLLDDSDSDSQRKRSSLASIGLQLNDDNQLETTSHISPEDEQALRSFLGGLNLVNSPEESAKDLYEKTAGLTDSKNKKLLKRKELEEYFIPIAQNPRFLDAISEEASDISDKECASSNKTVNHLKQTTPEQDLGPVVNEKPKLVEVKLVEPLQESVCSTKTVTAGEEKAEVVFIAESSQSSSNSSGNFDEARVESKSKEVTETICKDISNAANETQISTSFKNSTENLELSSSKLGSGQHIEPKSDANDLQESTSTVMDISSKTLKDTRGSMVVSELTSCHNAVSTSSFDYTKIPNILKEKEPENGNVKNQVKKEVVGAIGKNNAAEIEKRSSVSAVHKKKKTVNGYLDNAEFRKVRVDEVSRNGDMEVIKDFEEYTSKPNENNNVDQVGILNGISETSQEESIIEENDVSVDKNTGSTSRSTHVISDKVDSTVTKSSNHTSQTKEESMLRHVIMTSQDSNKTDSQKLLEFESIRQLNSELKDKITKQELIGPAFRTSKSPLNGYGKLKENLEPVVMHCEEELPGKAFVRKRVKEFSQHKQDTAEENTYLLEEGSEGQASSPRELKNLIQSRIETFSNGFRTEESVLKQIVLGDDINTLETLETSLAGTELEEKDNISGNIEASIPVKLENGNEIALDKEEGSVLKRILSCSKIDIASNAKMSIDHKEVIIPVELEVLNTGKIPISIEKEAEENFNMNEIVVPIETKAAKEDIKSSNIKEQIIPISLDSNFNLSQNVSMENTNMPLEGIVEKREGHSGDNPADVTSPKKLVQELIIPIEIINNKTEQIIPVKLETDTNTSIEAEIKTADIKSGVKERIIPIKIDNQVAERDVKLNNKKELIIPIKLETNLGIAVEGTKNINNSLKEETTKDKGSMERITDAMVANFNVKETVTPSVETPSNNEREITSSLHINQATSTLTDLTKENIQNINKSLKSILEKKEQFSTKRNSEDPTRQEVKNEPPIPPPRRSKAVLLQKRHENMKLPEAVQHPKVLQGSRDDIPASSDITYTNVISPPRPASANSDDSSSSEESSRCTAKYNPSSSIADVASITKDEESKQIYEPTSLRNIVLKALISLPFGEEILKELAEISKTIEYFTSKLPLKSNNVSGAMPETWYTEADTKRNSYEDEKRKIVELHQKFLTRRKYDESSNIPRSVAEDGRVTITGVDTRETQVISPNRLLTIIREEPNESEPLHFEDASSQRLKAKNLGEWLTLARHKSKSTSNLDCTVIPINNLRRTITGTQNEHANTRRRSLPQEIYEKQMIDIMEKEREIQRELEQLEEEKRKLRSEIAPSRRKQFQVDDFYVSKKGDFAEIREDAGGRKERPASMPAFPTEFFRQQMYEEYMDKFSERQERKQQKVIKISSSNDPGQDDKPKEIIHPVEIEQEFMDRVKEKLKRTNTETSEDASEKSRLGERDVATSSSDEAPVIVLDRDRLRGVETLPRHLQEFVEDLTTQQDESDPSKITISQCDKKCCKEARRIYRVLAKNKSRKNYSLLHEIDASLTMAKGFLLGKKGIWSPGQPRRPPSPPGKYFQRTDSQNSQSQNDPMSPVWTPKSANSSPTAERKEFRPVNFHSPVLSRKNRTRSETITTPDSTTSEPPWKHPEGSSDTALNLSSTLDRRFPTSQSSPGFGIFATNSRLPKAQNPTITLLQKAREGQLPRGAQYIEQDRRIPNDIPPIKYPGEVLYHIKNEYTSESDTEKPRKMADLAPRKFEGIGPTTKDGMPLILRSEVKDKDQSKWYKRMYDTIHKQKPHRDEYVTIRYKQKRAQYPYTSGYLSEPEPGAYDSDFTDYKYQTLDRRRTPQTQHYMNNTSTMPRSIPDNRSYSSSDIVRNTHERYNNQPGRIENYRPGHSSISEKEAKQWWDEVMDIFDGHLEQQSRAPPLKPRSFINQALKESGYESDSTLVFKRKAETAANQISPNEQKEAYKTIQKGGDVPFQGLRKPAPERPKETDLVEFFPISPTLTKIRIHKSITPAKESVIPEQEFFCYPATVHKTFANFKRTAPSSVHIGTPPPASTPPPSPPKRKSSRNNTTLRLISTMKVKTEKSPLCKRHETCFTSGSTMDRTKVNYLRDRITCKLSPVTKKKGDAPPKFSVVKKVSASPEMRSKITSTLTTSRDPKSSARKVQSSTKVSADKPYSSGLYKSGSTGSMASKKSSTESLSSRTSTPIRTFGTEKRKFDLTLPLLNSSKPKLSKASSEELLSPTEVRKGIKNISASSTHYKESTALLSNENKVLPIKVGITDKGKHILKSSIKKTSNVSPKVTRKATVQSPSLSTSSERSRIKSSTESLNAPKPIKKSVQSKSQHKSKKDQINDKLKHNTNKTVDQKCFSKATGADVAKGIAESSEISKQKEAMESNHFFRNLFLRNTKHSASFALPKSSWLIEKTNQLTRRRASLSEPSIGAMKIYLRHTRPVSDSRFISLDIIRSRSASPKSVTFSDNIAASKRSKSLPSKIVFSQTSRPISPVVSRRHKSPILKHHLATIKRSPSPPSKLVLTQTSRPISPAVARKKSQQDKNNNLAIIRRSPSPQTKLFFSETSRPISPDVRRRVRTESPPVSPVLPRSPSSRKIMQIKQQQTHEQSKPQELTLYTCPELKHSNTSLDSFRSEDYQVYLKDLVFENCEKFRDLNHFYNDIEKVGQLEKKFSSKPRRRRENEIIDYDRWMEVRTREKAEHELKHLYSHLKAHEKEKGFLFLPKDVERYKWKRELDRGLRIKEKSVENIKEEFERLKQEESERECAKRREIAYSKDTYKPLWRGNSVVNLASILTERRSQSEGRVKTARQKLLDSERLLSHGIGSRIWSSLSMEQVNNLKKQLQEIYGDEQLKESVVKDYIVEVPKQIERPQLTVRRNSESSKPDLMSEDEKKIISQTLSKEVLEKISKRRKEDKLALPLVVGKEVLGAVATQEANVKSSPRKEEPQKPLVKTNAFAVAKQCSVSETESASTDESTKTVINLQDVQKKVEYFEKAKELESYIPTVYKPAEDGSSNSEDATSPTEPDKSPNEPQKTIHQSKSCQSLKEYFGETELVKFATLPLSATRKSDYTYIRKPHLRALDISPIRTILETNSLDSLNRSRSASPYYEEAQALAKKGEVKKLKRHFEFFEDFFGEKKLKRSRSENDLRAYGHVDDLRRKYEYPVYSGRGRSRVKRGGMVSPVWLRAEDRYMPHINIISKIASLYSFSKHRTDKEASKSMEELAEILGCPVGEVEKMKEKFDRIREHEEQISLMGHMYTSSPSLKELRDITPYLTANWIAHRYPRSEDNTRSLSSPETSIASRDTSLVRRDRQRSKSSPPIKRGPRQSILKREGARTNERFEISSRYTKDPDLPPPPPPPKSQGGVRSQESESPRKYVENEVTIHYKTPVRTEIKEYVSEDELAHRQAEAMKRIYEEERKRKYLQVSKSLQELHDMKSRRHTDNFIPSQKSPIPLNRYDDFDDLTTPTKTRTRSPEPRLVAKALYNFVGQTARELTFRKGDLIYVRRQVDKNWYEGELNAMVGLFPVNYVEIVPYEGIKTTPRKAHEGQARAKYNFLAQTHLELSLAKGELVTVTRRVDDNWFEGKIGGRKGIFPVAYVDILIDPSDPPPPSTKPVASPAAHSLLLNGSAQGKESMGSHLYTPNVPSPLTARDNGYHHAKPVQLTGSGTYSTLPKTSNSPIDQTLHIETQSEPIPYRALYKYRPQNDDELELLEGDTVYVLEKCDDGWFVGSSDRTGAFGTFPGNYVEKI